MRHLFKRTPRAAASTVDATGVDLAALGTAVVALAVPAAIPSFTAFTGSAGSAGSIQAAACSAILIDASGGARRFAAAARSRLPTAPGETAWLFHPGPYRADLRPFASAPEMGLRLNFVIDAPDPHAHQQRFDLYLASEVQGSRTALTSEQLIAAIEAALRQELAQGHLALPPCTTLEEWNSFRAGLNRLLYLRFGVTVDECLPVDLGDRVDFAAMLAARALDDGAAPAITAAGLPTPPPMPTLPPPAIALPGDAACLRRLFLELPGLMCALRMALLPQDSGQFQRHQGLLRRLDLVSLQITTMPALALAAPALPLAADQQARRLAHARRACTSLDQAWALLARMQALDADADADAASAIQGVLDDAERIVANLECDVDGRRRVDEVAP